MNKLCIAFFLVCASLTASAQASGAQSIGASAATTASIHVDKAQGANAKVGDVVTVSGTVRVDKDFGAGYAYKVLLKDATFLP